MNMVRWSAVDSGWYRRAFLCRKRNGSDRFQHCTILFLTRLFQPDKRNIFPSAKKSHNSDWIENLINLAHCLYAWWCCKNTLQDTRRIRVPLRNATYPSILPEIVCVRWKRSVISEIYCRVKGLQGMGIRSFLLQINECLEISPVYTWRSYNDFDKTKKNTVGISNLLV